MTINELKVLARQNTILVGGGALAVTVFALGLLFLTYFLPDGPLKLAILFKVIEVVYFYPVILLAAAWGVLAGVVWLLCWLIDFAKPTNSN